jgi:hypothetical protein
MAGSIARGVAIFSAVWLSAGAASAMPLLPLAPVEETYSRTVNVDGFLLVGLRRGPAPGRIDLAKLKVEIPAGQSGDLCLRLTTRDATYSARQGFSLSGAGAGVHEIPVKTQFAHELEAYAAADLAARAEIRPQCGEGPGGVVVPVLIGETQSSTDVVAMVNLSASVVSISITDSGNTPLVRGTCEAISHGSDTAYNRTCVLGIDPASARRAAKLRIVEVGATGSPEVEQYPISLAGLP